MADVELRGLRKSFGSEEVIPGLDLSIADGEFVALVGPSGCGKSTMLRMIAGLEAVSGGTIVIEGEVVNDLSPRERNIAMVFQSYALYPHMSVRENMAFNLRLAGKGKEEIRARVAEAAKMLGLEPLLNRRPSQLSGGQRQRVAMGRAIVRDPAVFLFDEPLSNLDAKLRIQMRTEIKMLYQKLGTTSIYVTHDQIEAMTLANRIVVLNRGRIEQHGTPMELYRNPANLFVAGFIGTPTMNFIDARASRRSGQTIAALSNGANLVIEDSVNVQDGQQVILGMRPEHLVLAGSEGVITGNVVLIEPTGAQTHVALELGKERVLVVVDGERDVRLGQTLTVSIPSQYIHVFDPEKGARLNEGVKGRSF